MSGSQYWLDKVLAVPAIGIVTETWLGFAAGVWEALERNNAKWKSDGQGRVNIRVTSAVDIRVERDRGLYLALTPSSAVAGYTFNLSTERRPGALPQLVSDMDATKYTELQTTAANLLLEFLKTGFPSSKEHEVVRVGVQAESRLIESEAPPGVTRYIGDLECAVRNKLTVIQGSMVAEVATRADGHDQCHHGAARNSLDQPDDLSLRLDWQRIWKPPARMTSARLAEEIRTATQLANSYCEHFGSGEV